MSYIFKQKLNISDLVEVSNPQHRILICEPENDLAGLYSYYLKADNFYIQRCSDWELVSQIIAQFQPQILIFNAESHGSWLELTTSLRRLTLSFPQLRLISLGYNLSHQSVGELMGVGVCGHVNRRLSRPQDLAVIVKNVLNN